MTALNISSACAESLACSDQIMPLRYSESSAHSCFGWAASIRSKASRAALRSDLRKERRDNSSRERPMKYMHLGAYSPLGADASERSNGFMTACHSARKPALFSLASRDLKALTPRTYSSWAEARATVARHNTSAAAKTLLINTRTGILIPRSRFWPDSGADPHPCPDTRPFHRQKAALPAAPENSSAAPKPRAAPMGLPRQARHPD